jgi:hypothetical protein
MKRALVLVFAACLPPNSTPPTADLSHVIVRTDTGAVGMPARAWCEATCPPPVAGEQIAYCHGAAITPALLAHRRALGEKTIDGALVCAYQRLR